MLKLRSHSICNSINTFVSSTLYTTITHAQLISRHTKWLSEKMNGEQKGASILFSVEISLSLYKNIQNIIIIII